MKITILHNAVSQSDAIEDQDVLVQVDVVADALRQLGHETSTLPCTLDLDAVRRALDQRRPGLVFNLVEGLEGWDSLSSLAPALLDAMGIAYTGNSTEATFLTTHKLLAKERLRHAGLPTPDWIATDDRALARAAQADSRWIIKGVWEQASRNLDEEAIVDGDVASVGRRLAEWSATVGRPSYAEQFIAGREFNVALLAGPSGPRVLPPAEIDFTAFPPDKPRIVGYRAKWIADSFEYNNTPRRFDFAPDDEPLLVRLRELAARSWDVFGLAGYVRVDFRVDDQGRPWILEVNTNPCLSPDAGFAAALGRAEIPFVEAIEAIVNAAARGPRPCLNPY